MVQDPSLAGHATCPRHTPNHRLFTSLARHAGQHLRAAVDAHPEPGQVAAIGIRGIARAVGRLGADVQRIRGAAARREARRAAGHAPRRERLRRAVRQVAAVQDGILAAARPRRAVARLKTLERVVARARARARGAPGGQIEAACLAGAARRRRAVDAAAAGAAAAGTTATRASAPRAAATRASAPRTAAAGASAPRAAATRASASRAVATRASAPRAAAAGASAPRAAATGASATAPRAAATARRGVRGVGVRDREVARALQAEPACHSRDRAGDRHRQTAEDTHASWHRTRETPAALAGVGSRRPIRQV